MYDINKLKILRQQTGVSFSLCKKALEETKNNLEKAKKLLCKWGADKALDKTHRKTSAGAIFSYVHHNKRVASLVELNCETDFVSGNKDFQTLGNELAMQVASLKAEKVKELLEQEYIRDPSKKISDLIKEAVLKFGENIKINRIVRWSL
ncbi:elongation factor Ts [Candidatus Roizmanbacteria bacterium CG22_combo_CG10-13_8_21_14_all_35_9]|uniref:Elongation factor Ts n=4 Tax=Candidatus Roizmaniibacteriota TaxID=1752723 RepID=A0A2M8F3Z9_9BACT|nr:MAG: elongation factor Ts [Candidatus Roizmanbacteria bacterium CG23_combo_of_CG06-09_8_20_14_all_35_49]PIP63080.1 MAG: elongation factor Ts [Candidatus Roizmanbacteria bacterium CG22_combo_CG10-13_8_21_14_all_35_9]PIY70829.1 MAG: elongation factor Ts [Candidatus Roizmanbacteria bacterium CG_4_10_14_0_8_um_filter_35_28]PJC34034.1 MAG: elongation factor Ts [Candidatus Roizmanbacteria bacterium CG_4_9_14_0_2_um_filter_35_15]PJC82478.1 MAG: elongation factor Ts [Candidatus Roizmanbacteria bacte